MMKTPDERKEFLRRLQLAASEADDMLGSCDASDILDSLEESRDYMFESANLIEQLESQVPKWISVEERLPETHEDGSVDAALVTDGYLIHMAYFSSGKWFYCSSGEMKENMFYEVTHWIPLPEPPKEDDACMNASFKRY